jgi:hypothetical protein
MEVFTNVPTVNLILRNIHITQLWGGGGSLATGWTAEGSEFESLQTGSGAHPAYYSMGTGGSLSANNAAGA